MESAAGRVTSIARVQEELQQGRDWLANWPTEQEASERMFPPPVQKVKELQQRVAAYAHGLLPDDPDEAMTFLNGADSWLVAYALYVQGQLTHSPIVVTCETSDRPSPGIKLPDVCDDFNIEWNTPFEMLRRSNVLFMLGKKEVPTLG